MNREQWLELAVEKMRLNVFSPVGETVPPVRVSIGFPKGNARKVIGQYWNATAVRDGKPQVFISPTLEGHKEILETLAHELIHAIVPDAKHGRPFRKIMRSIGLEGKPTATIAGPALIQRLNNISEELGPIPQSAIDIGTGPVKKQSTRMIKVECSECGYIARTTRKFLEMIGPPLCACNEKPMKP